MSKDTWDAILASAPLNEALKVMRLHMGNEEMVVRHIDALIEAKIADALEMMADRAERKIAAMATPITKETVK